MVERLVHNPCGGKVSDVTLRMKWQYIVTILRVADEMYFLMILIVTPITLQMWAVNVVMFVQAGVNVEIVVCEIKGRYMFTI